MSDITDILDRDSIAVLRAFWRRVQPVLRMTGCINENELPAKIPIQLTANMRTALCALKFDDIEARLAAAEADAGRVTGETSDGYHTFNELYEFRKMYNAALFNEWAITGKYSVHKSWRHHDGEPCFGGGWFIVVAMLPSGQITNHYKADDWVLFQIPEHDKALFGYDGHNGADTILRLRAAIDTARGVE